MSQEPDYDALVKLSQGGKATATAEPDYDALAKLSQPRDAARDDYFAGTRPAEDPADNTPGLNLRGSRAPKAAPPDPDYIRKLKNSVPDAPPWLAPVNAGYQYGARPAVNLALDVAGGAFDFAGGITERAGTALGSRALQTIGGAEHAIAGGIREKALPSIPGYENTPGTQISDTLAFIGGAVAAPEALGAETMAAKIAPGAAAAGLEGFSGTYRNVKAQGGTENAAFVAGLASAGLNAGAAAIPLGRLAKVKVGGMDLGNALTHGYVFGGVAGAQTVMNDAVEKIATHKDLSELASWAEVERAGGAAVVGTLAGWVVGAVELAAKRVASKAPKEQPSKPIEEPATEAKSDAAPPGGGVGLDEAAPERTAGEGKASAEEKSQTEVATEPSLDAENKGVSPEANEAAHAVEAEASATTDDEAPPFTEPESKRALPLKKTTETTEATRGLPIEKAVEPDRPPIPVERVVEEPKRTIPLRKVGAIEPEHGAAKPEGDFYPSAESKVEELVRVVADRFNTLRRVEREAPGKGSDFTGTETRMHGRAAYAQRTLERIQDRAVVAMKRAGITAQDMADYATARHAAKRNEIIAGRTEGENLEGSGMSDARAAEVLAKAKPEAADIMRLHDAVRDRALSFAVESGLISDETAAAWKDTFGDTFTSLKSIGEDSPRSMPGAGKSLQVKGKEAKRAEGRGTEATNPFVSMFQNAQEVILRGEKNIVAQQFGKLVEENPGAWAEFEKPEGAHAPSGEDVFTYKVNGEPRYIRVHDAGTLKAVKNLDPVVAGTFMRGVQKLGRLYSSLATARNPDFIAGNLVRDLETAVGNSATEDSLSIAKDIVKGALPAAKEIGLAIHKPESAKGYAKEYLEHGALTDWIEPTDALARLRSVEAKLSETSLRTKLRAGVDVLNSISEAVENGTRFSYYKALRERGISADVAAVRAKELTVNWSKKGEMGATMNALYLFASANANGTLRFAQAWKNNPIRASKVAAGFTAAGIVMGLYNRMYGGTDEKDGRDWWGKQTEAQKRRNMMIQHNDGSTTRIPLAPGWGYFTYLGDKIAGVIVGEKPDAGNVVGAAVQQLSPVDGGSVAQTVTPWFLDPIVALGENKDFAGRDVYTDRDRRDKRPYGSLPGEQRATSGARAASRLANWMSGGNDARQGALDIPPRGIDYTMAETTSGAGRFLQRVVKTGEAIFSGEKPMWRDVPIIARFKGDAPNTYRGEFYEALEQIEAEATAKKGNQPFDAKVLGFKGNATRIAKLISDLRANGKDDDAEAVAAKFVKRFDARQKP